MRERYRKEIKAGRYRISYYAKGRGRPLILLHGILGTSYSFRHIFETLALTKKVIVPDLLGCGQSGKPAKYDYSLKSDADVLRKFIEELKLKNIALCGVSTGGALALKYALEYPQDLEKLIIVDSFGLKKSGRKALGIDLDHPSHDELADRQKLTKIILKQFNQEIVLSDRDREKTIGDLLAKPVPECMQKRIKASGLFEVGGIEKIALPALIIWGERDRVLPRSMAEKFVRKLKNARYVMIPEAGHLPHEESPEDFMTVLLDFLQDGIPHPK